VSNVHKTVHSLNIDPIFSKYQLYSTISFSTRRYIGYVKDQKAANQSVKVDSLMALFALLQSILLGSFAAILAAHRSEILDQPSNAVMHMMDEMQGGQPQRSVSTPENSEYEPPNEK
jgi:hypothetical protein